MCADLEVCTYVLEEQHTASRHPGLLAIHSCLIFVRLYFFNLGSEIGCLKLVVCGFP
jgi:hypothetical protein